MMLKVHNPCGLSSGSLVNAVLSPPKDVLAEENAEIVDVLLRVSQEARVGVNRTARFGLRKILKLNEE